MPPTQPTRGYGAEDENERIVTGSPRESTEPAEASHDQGGPGHGGGHGHHDEAPNPDAIEQSNSSFDDIYITSGGKKVDSAPIGALTPFQVVDAMTPPPIPYRVDWIRAIVAGLVATLTFTPIFYILYFGYRDDCFDLGLLLGALVSPALDWTTRLIGLGIHLGVGVVFALTYAYLLFIFRTQSGAGRGSQFAIGVCFFMMTFGMALYIGAIARLLPWHPRFTMSDFLLNEAGPSNVGWGPMVISLLAHGLWGMILGHLYRHKVLIAQIDDQPRKVVAAHGH